MIDVAAFVRIALDPVRLAILGRAVAGPIDIPGLAEELGMAHRRVEREYARLVGSGLVADGRLDVDVLRDLARSLPAVEQAAQSVTDGPWSESEARILGTFFSGSRLTEIPAGHAKRLVVLERLAQEFQPGLRYPERDVNATLQLFHADYAALRRHLVDEGFLTRADGVYWRTGGRV